MTSYYTGTNLGLLAEWAKDSDRPFVCVVPNRSCGETLLVNLRALHGDRVEILPDWDINPGEDKLPGEQLQQRRLRVLNLLRKEKLTGLIIPCRALGIPVIKPGALPSLKLEEGMIISPRQIISKLTDLGFERQPLAQENGDYSLRGDLLDFFPENHRLPIRVSFFDDEIEKIEYYHPSSQMRAGEEIQLPVELTLQSEFALSPDRIEQLKQHLQSSGYTQQAQVLEYSRTPGQAANWFSFWPRPLTYPENLFENQRLAIYRPGQCWEEIKNWEEKLNTLPDPSPAEKTFRNITDVLNLIQDDSSAGFFQFFCETPICPAGKTEQYGQTVAVGTGPGLEPQPVDDFINIISGLAEKVQIIEIHCGGDPFKKRLEQLLKNKLGSSRRVGKTELFLYKTHWRGSYRIKNRATVSLDDFFNRTIQQGRIGTSQSRTEYLASFEELDPGDLVVHEDFGIGRFRGLKRVETENASRDCLFVEYAGEDRLYLPPDQIARIQKYIADSGYQPELSSLTTKHWRRVKHRVQEDVDELAEELLDLYMHREDNTSVPFPEDSLEQIQFEASFPYNETFDQQKGIEEVKEDMKKPRPMDRLICGDSGYGKTEVALRAAFKAVDAGRQVAMLVPTTVLARQHYETFSSRFSLFPYKVEMLSRFRTASESKNILEELKEGRVDIVIGTHRLLSEDIDFADLGLLVIDEEQRFGVRQKEKLKFYRKNVDVLTLTATPIPRTLYMSLSGIQDISVINTPPEERVAIKTEVGPFEPQKARQALERELSRGGQVFWVYNRVKKIKQITDYVRSLLPEARIAYGHGQMSKGDLKQVMNSFYAGGIDILVCTTIIEAGLDCPNANTMIIQNSHRFGLAQLYQLRGRIGRSHEQAYAYLFYPPKTKITGETEARLSTIKECSELGSGFRLAMRDLEIRGAGNLLGKNQHGNIRAVGFPLYCRLLQRSIRRLREGFEEPEPLPRLKLPGNYYIPHEYIPDEKQITVQYQELASCRKKQEVHDLARRWKETFGPIPDPAKMLLKRHIFKIMAVENGWNDFRYQNQRLNMRFTKEPPTQLLKAARKANARPSTRSNRLFIEKLTTKKIEQWLTHIGITLNP